MGKTCIEEELFIRYATGYEHNRDVLPLCPLQDAKGQFAHERLTVSRAFARNNEIGILQQVIEMNGIQQEVDA